MPSTVAKRILNPFRLGCKLFARHSAPPKAARRSSLRTEGGEAQIPPAAGGNKKEKPPDWVVFFLVAEVGFESPTRKYSRLGRVRGSAHPILLIFSLVALALSRTASARAPSPLPHRRFATAEVVKEANHTVAKRKATQLGCFLFGCGGGI